MSEPLKITSTKNPRIKYLLELQSKPKARKQERKFVIEGLLEVKRAAEADYKLEVIFINENLLSLNEVRNMIPELPKDIIIISQELYEKIAYRKTTGGIIAIAIPKDHSLGQLKISSNPLILIVEAVEKPGNLGALLRTVDSAGLDGLIICDPATDLYNPNIIRSSIGAVFTTPVGIATSEEAIEWLKKHQINIYSSALTASERYDQVDFKIPSAIVMGTESTGLSDAWLQNSTRNIIIPMQGVMDSLNVSVSAAIIVFEAVRQRDFKLN